MPLQIPTRGEVVASLQAFTRANVPDLDPTVTRRRGFIGGLVRSLGSALHDWYVRLKKYADREPFPQTATEGFFSQGWWLDITGLTRNAASPAHGFVALTGTTGTIVPAGTTLIAGQSTYETYAATTILTQTLVGASSGYDGVVGRFVTEEPHNLATGMTVTISGAPDASLNGSYEIRVVDANTIDYDLAVALTGTPVAADPQLTATWGNATITCTETGPAGNIDEGSTLSLGAPISGVDETVRVTFGGVADGADTETLESWRARVLEALGTDFGTFSADEIRIVAKTVPGVTRVFVREAVRFVEEFDETGNPRTLNGINSSGDPIEGRVRIAFLRDNDADPIPSALEVKQVRDKIHSTILPAHTLPEDCEVLAPERYGLSVRFRSISPDTPGMRASIRANILQFLFEEATWGGRLEIEGLRCAIRSAYDTDTGRSLSAYELDTPTADIALPVDAYPVLTSIRWTL